VSLSSATAADLEALDGVGPALAARIVAWRDSNGGFSSVDQLDEVPGIGPARMEALRPLLVP
jgi:competence ComEA-like helix-hairpin-helix protein